MEVERGYIRTVLPADVLDPDVERDSEGYLGGLVSNTSESISKRPAERKPLEKLRDNFNDYPP